MLRDSATFMERHNMHATHLLILAATLAAAPEKPVAVKMLESFESEAALSPWLLRDVKGELVAQHATQGKRAARLVYPKWQEGTNKWPATILDFGKGAFDMNDWSRYDVLKFDVFNDTGREAILKLRLDDAGKKRWTTLFRVPSRQPHTCEVAIARLGIDSKRVVHFDLYMTQPAIDSVYYVDNIRLEARSIQVQAARLMPDVFMQGRIRAHCQLSRPAPCQVQVADAAGRVAAVAEHTDATVSWQWDGRVAGQPAEPGPYTVSLKVQDSVSHKTIEQKLGEFTVAPVHEQPPIVCWYEPTTRKVMLDAAPERDDTLIRWDDITAKRPDLPPIQVDMARNEFEGAQVVFMTRAKQAKFRFAIEELRHASSGTAFPMARSAVWQVGYIETRDPKMYKVEHVGWWPDPLVPAKEMLAEPGEAMPIWVSLKSEPNTPPGVYGGRLSIWLDDRHAGFLPMSVRVHDVTLPRTTTVRTAFSTYNGMIKQAYGGTLTPEMWRKYQEFIADHRINPDNIYRSSPPPIEDVEYFAKRGQLNAFNLMYIRKSDQKHPYDAAHLARIAKVLDPYVAELRKRKLVHLAYIYGFDEVKPEQFPAMRRAFGFLKKRYPEIPLVTTGYDHSFGIDSELDDVVDIWVPLTSRYDLAKAEAARKRGKEVWWYICIGPRNPYANWFVEYTALEPRLLWWMTFQHRVPGFLYYTMTRWQHQREPLRVDGHNKTNWIAASYKTANGDGSLFCGGPDGPLTTIRFENVRDGIEDCELLTLLAKRVGDGGASGRALCDEVIPTLTTFTRDVHKFARVRLLLLEQLAQTR